MDPRARRSRGAAPDPLPDQRALVRVPPVLDQQGLRRLRAHHAPAVQRLDPVPAGPGAEVAVLDRVHRGRRRRGPGHLAVPRALPGAGPDLAGAAVHPAGHLPAVHRGHAVRRDLLVPVPRRGRDLLPRRREDPVQRRVGPGPRAGEGQGEHRLPGEPGVDRVQGRLRARRHPAVGPARHRQDPDGRGGRRRDRQAVRLRRPRRVHQHVHGRRHPQGQVAVPQAAQARAALRRRDRLPRRGRLAGQPRRDLAGPRLPARRHAGPVLRRHRLPRVLVPVLRGADAADPLGDAAGGASRSGAAGSSWAA